MSNTPIAIVGRGCLLPGAHDPSTLSRRVLAGEDLVTQVPPGRWGIDPERILGGGSDRALADRGGYVTGFEGAFDPEGFALPSATLRGLDPLFEWVLHAARGALLEGGFTPGDLPRAGAVLGNLSFPSEALSRFSEATWLRAAGFDDRAIRGLLGRDIPDPRSRFMSGLPALLLGPALGLSLPPFALDAACASALYALKYACDALADGRADLMLAGAVNRADDLFIHVGFTALKALSPTGQSRPFHREADGLVPAEGVGIVALMTLSRAQAEGRPIFGVIRGVGLANDGRAGGFLAPDAKGQVRAMEAAYRASGLTPADIDLVECHATGTRVGDGTELESMGQLFAGQRGVPIGSLKSNMGHLITAAGVAGLFKVLGAMEAGQIPPSLHASDPHPSLAGGPFRVPAQAEAWEAAKGAPRRAAISAFGFGGNNAHLIIEAPPEGGAFRGPLPTPTPPPAAPIAIVALGARVGDGTSATAFARALFGQEALSPRAEGVSVGLKGLRFPPKDLQAALPQQTLLLEAAREAVAQVRALPRETTGIYIGMGADPEVARYGARWRARQWEGDLSAPGFGAAAEAGTIPVLESAGVLGTMPNIPANRLNLQLDLAGPSFTVSAEEASGLSALALACRALRAGELDAALVGAVDLCGGPVHGAAAEILEPRRQAPGDGALTLVLRRLEDAEALGETVLAVLEEEPGAAGLPPLRLGLAPEHWDLTGLIGHPHAASGLLYVAAAALSLHHRKAPGGAPLGPIRRAEVGVLPMAGAGHRAFLRGHRSAPKPLSIQPRLHAYRGADRARLLSRLRSGEEGGMGPVSLAIVCAPDALEAKRARTIEALERGAPLGGGIVFRDAPVEGELAFVFTGAGAAYPGMGAAAVEAIPDLVDDLVSQGFGGFYSAMRWALASEPGPGSVFDKLWGSSGLSQLHARFSLRVLGLKPAAAIGYSSGETNALFALGAWRDLDAMVAESHASGIFDRAIGGDFEAVKAAWGGDAGPIAGPINWTLVTITAPIEEIRARLEGEPRVHLAIVHHDEEGVIAGDADPCRRVAESFGPGRSHALDYPLAVHVPELGTIAEPWLALHRRETTPVPGVRFYSNGVEGAFSPTRESAAQAILDQGCQTLDLPRTIEAAYADGVRIFLEHGPQGAASRWIQAILGDRASGCLIVPLDQKGRGLEPLLTAAAHLWAAGLNIDLNALNARLQPASAAVEGPTLKLPAHLPPVALPGPRPLERAAVKSSQPSSLSASPSPSKGATARLAPPPAVAPALGDAAFYGRRDPSLEAPMTLPLPPSLYALEDHPTATAAPPRAPATPAAPIPPTPPRVAQLHPPQAPAFAMAPASGMAQPAPYASSPSPMGSPMAAQGSPVGAVHNAYLASQSLGQRQFLESRQRMMAHVVQLALRGGMPHPMSAFQPAPMPPSIQRAPAPPTFVPPSAPRTLEPPPAPQTFEPPPAPRPPAAPQPPAPPAPAATPQTAAPAPLIPEVLPGFTLERAGLKTHASGKISEIYGDLFAPQDGYHRQVRMPEPPLLLADRMTGIDAEAGSMKTGTIWTETDVTEDSWYLHEGRMPAGVMIESGQADLMLISYLGVDLLNRGERVYRLLGCDLTYHRSLPAPGETLAYDIHVDGHAKQGDVRLFFFHYDCHIGGERALSVRGGQAGFFTDQELAESAGCLWSAEEAEPCAAPRMATPEALTTKTAFGPEEIAAFAAGDVWGCFGEGFEFGRTHVWSPRIQRGRMTFLHRINDFAVSGGPWGRGYLKAEADITPEDWFFEGHFKNDPCMPGTLMFEGCLQAMAFYLAGLGFTLKRDGWRFEPVKGETFPLRCRGQVIPSSKLLTYEVFVEEVVGGETPTLYADLLCTVDGLKAFHAKRVGLELVPDWPMGRMPKLLKGYTEPKPVASADGFAFDYKSLMACAWGRPSEAFGEMYQIFDGHRRVARLPGPPYHFMSRVSRIDGEIGAVRPGATIEIEYDIPPDAWYYRENACNTMPYCVLLEAVLQPCGWLASFVGSAASVDEDLSFRNLDGAGTVLAELPPDTGTIRTVVNITNVSKTAGMIIESFDVQCFAGDTRVYDLKTVFGFFPKVALENQVGLPTTPLQRQLLEGPSDFFVDLETRPAAYCGGGLRLPEPMLLMIDRVTGYWPEGGEAGLGQLRAEKDVRQQEWFFKAHFFQDPVQPGSLGIEAMIQLLQFYMLERGMGEGIAQPRFEAIATGRPMSWKYRGQVIPSNKVISSTLEVTEVGEDDVGVYALAKASLWVDGKRIYEADGLGMRIVSGAGPFLKAPHPGETRHTVDPKVDRWIGDHRPTFTRPALPMMSAVDYLAQGVPGPLKSLEDVRLKGWILIEEKTHLVTRVEGDRVLLYRGLGDAGEEIASARFVLGAWGARPEVLPPTEGEPQADPYASGRLFHGPAFQVMTRWILGPGQASGWLMAGGGALPLGRLNPALLDGATHVIPHDALERVDAGLDASKVTYPFSIKYLNVYGSVPADGEVRCEMRYLGPEGGDASRPSFKLQLIFGGAVAVELVLVEACFPKGPLGEAEPEARRAFLKEGIYTDGVGLSAVEGDTARLKVAHVLGSDWLPGTVEAVYGSRDPRVIVAKDAMGAATGIHPGRLPEALPLTRFHQDVTEGRGEVIARTTAPPSLDISPVKAYWTKHFDHGPWPVEDLYYAMIEAFVGRVVLADPPALEAVRGRSVLYLANHQVASESLIFSILASGLMEVPTVTVAKAEHRHTWLGRLIQHSFAYPGIVDPEVITFFDRENKEDLLRIIQDLGRRLASGKRSVMVHVEGTRSLTCRAPVEKMAGAFIDMALKVGCPIVPVRFVGGLPGELLPQRLEFPLGLGRQDLYLGAPLHPEALASMPYGERKARVIAAMNALGPDHSEEAPLPGDAALQAEAKAWADQTGASPEHAVLWALLKRREDLCPESQALVRAVKEGQLPEGEGATGPWLRTLAARFLGEAEG